MNRILFLLQLLLCITQLTTGQISAKLAEVKGFKEIKLLNNLSSVKISDQNLDDPDHKLFKYAGDSKTIYYTSLDQVAIETNSDNIIRKIKLFLPVLNDDDFFAFSDKLKSDFGQTCFIYSKKNQGDGSLVWRTNEYYMEYIYRYASWGKWTPTIVIGMLKDLSEDIRKLYIGDKDDFGSTENSQPTSNSIPMIENGGVYEIPITINNTLKINFIFDAGATDVSISPDVALTLIRTGTVTDKDFIGTATYKFADGSKAKSKVFIIKELKIGNKSITNVKASISNSIQAPLLLGQSALNRFGKITIDYTNKVIRFED